MHKLLFIAYAALLMAAVSCSKSEPDNSCGGVDSFRLNDPFLLCWGTTASQTGQNFQVKFDNLVEESRCPTDVDCIQAGRASVALVLTYEGVSKTDTLTIGDFFGTTHTDSTLFEGYKIRLLEVQPVPVSTAQPAEADYKVKLLITK